MLGEGAPVDASAVRLDRQPERHPGQQVVAEPGHLLVAGRAQHPLMDVDVGGVLLLGGRGNREGDQQVSELAGLSARATLGRGAGDDLLVATAQVTEPLELMPLSEPSPAP